jgi:hypothetical protein
MTCVILIPLWFSQRSRKAKGERRKEGKKNLGLQDLYELVLRNDGGFAAILNLQQLWMTADY